MQNKKRISKKQFINGNDENYYYIHFYKAPYGICSPCGDDNDKIFLKYKNQIYRFGQLPKFYGNQRMILSEAWTSDEKQKLKDILEKEFMVPKNGFYDSSEIYCKININYIDLSKYVKESTFNNVPGF